MVVVEGGLDALAFAELDHRDDTIYVSTGGGVGSGSMASLRKLAEGKTVISAFGHDAEGEPLDRALREMLPKAVRLAPPSQLEGSAVQCMDWLNVVRVYKSGGTEHLLVLGQGAVDEDQLLPVSEILSFSEKYFI